MASMLKSQTANAAKADLKGKGKRQLNEDADGDQVMADGEAPAKRKRNKQRVLLLSSRGITHRMRHLMNDLEVLLPHVKKGESQSSTRNDRETHFILFATARLKAGLKIATAPPARARRPAQLQ